VCCAKYEYLWNNNKIICQIVIKEKQHTTW